LSTLTVTLFSIELNKSIERKTCSSVWTRRLVNVYETCVRHSSYCSQPIIRWKPNDVDFPRKCRARLFDSLRNVYDHKECTCRVAVHSSAADEKRFPDLDRRRVRRRWYYVWRRLNRTFPSNTRRVHNRGYVRLIVVDASSVFGTHTYVVVFGRLTRPSKTLWRRPISDRTAGNTGRVRNGHSFVWRNVFGPITKTGREPTRIQHVYYSLAPCNGIDSKWSVRSSVNKPRR